MLLLTYTFAFTPVAVAFFWNAPPCFRSPTLEFDLFLDIFFILEIFLHFFVGIERQGMYVDDFRVRVCCFGAMFGYVFAIPCANGNREIKRRLCCWSAAAHLFARPAKAPGRLAF